MRPRVACAGMATSAVRHRQLWWLLWEERRMVSRLVVVARLQQLLRARETPRRRVSTPTSRGAGAAGACSVW